MKFSVALCTYNGEPYIQQQLNSILAQSLPVNEIVICDDNSQDNTVALAEDILRNSGISYQILVNDPPLGVADNFLKALKHTSGDYAFTCDQDDIWHTDKVQIFANAIAKTHKLLYFSDGRLVDCTGAPLGKTIWQTLDFVPDLQADVPLLHTLLKRPLVTGAAMAVSRELIDSVCCIPSLWLHDEWLSMYAALHDSIISIRQPTFDYRQHGHNVVGAKKLNFFQKSTLWFSYISKLKTIRRDQFKKKSDIMEIASGTPYESLVASARDFWGSLCQLEEKRFFSRLGIIWRLFRDGRYSAFYSGFRGFIRDLITCFFR